NVGNAALSGLVVGRGAAPSARRRRGSVWWRHIGDYECAAVLLYPFDDALVNLAQPGVDRLLPLNVLSVQPGNHLSIRLLPLVVRLVSPAQKNLPTCSLVITHPPTARLVTIEFLHHLINGSSNCSNNAELGKI